MYRILQVINVTQIGGVFMANERNDETEQLLQKIKELSEKNATLEQIIALQKAKKNSGNNESKSTKTRVDIMTPKQVWNLLSDKKRLQGVELYFESGNNNFVLDGKRLPKEYFNIYESNKNNRGFNENIFIILTRDLAITPKIQLSPEEKTIQDVQDALALDEYNKKRISLFEKIFARLDKIVFKIADFSDEHFFCYWLLLPIFVGAIIGVGAPYMFNQEIRNSVSSLEDYLEFFKKYFLKDIWYSVYVLWPSVCLWVSFNLFFIGLYTKLRKIAGLE